MEWSKLKNIIIMILLLVNLFLLIMVGVQERDAVRYQEQALADAVTALENNGIWLAEESIPQQMSIGSMTVQRDRELENQLTAELLGECEVSDLGSGRYAYKSSLGFAEFRSNGNFSIVFSDGIPVTGGAGGETVHALALCAESGLQGVLAEREETEDGTVNVALYQTWQGIPVYSCQITLQYWESRLISISGQRLMGTPQADNTGGNLISLPTVLMRILTGVKDLGDICREIVGLSPGYQITNPAEGTRMGPVWHVTTDTGSYWLNAITGKLERA